MDEIPKIEPVNGKGCRYRPVDKRKYDKSFERVFGKRKLNIWPRDRKGNLIE